MVEYKRKSFVNSVESKEDPQAVTKQDLRGVAYLRDLQGFIKKEDIKNTITKDDLKGYALRNEFKSFESKFVLKKSLSEYASKADLDRALKVYSPAQLATKAEVADHVERRELENFVTKNGLASLVSPSKLAEFLTSKSLEGLVKREDLDPYILRKDALFSFKAKQSVNGSLDITGQLRVQGKEVLTRGFIGRNRVRIEKSGPVQLTGADEVLIVKNNNDTVFGVFLPPNPEKGHSITIKDGAGNSYENTIKILPKGPGTIDGKECIMIRENYECIRLIFNGQEWNLL